MNIRIPDLSIRTTHPSARIASGNRILGLSIAIWSVAAGLVLTREPGPIALAGSLAIGWSHLAGRCGQSHLGALTPRGKLKGERYGWLINILVYAASGAVASIAVGSALAGLGALMVPTEMRTAALAPILLLAFVAVALELHVIRWRLPDPNRQTRREWGYTFRPPIPAALWGFSLGLTFATVFTFSGIWLVLALPLAIGEPQVGAAVLLAHWLGRAAPVLFGPVLLDHPAHIVDLLDDVERSRALFRASNIAGSSLMALAVALWILEAIK